MKKIAFLFFGISFSSLLSARNKLTIYYDHDWKITTSENFEIKREAEMDFSKFIFDGEFKDFDRGNHLIGEGVYAKGVKVGIHKTYFENGSLKSSIEWNGDDFTIIDLKGESIDLSVNGGTGKFKANYWIPFSRTKIHGLLIGEFKNKARVGKWIYYDSLGQPLFEESYRRGDFLRAIVFYRDGMAGTLIKKSILGKGGVVTPSLTTRPVNKLDIKLQPYQSIDRLDFDKAKYKNIFSFFSTLKEFCNKDTISGVQYAGGENDYKKIIARSVHYPLDATLNKSQGTALVRVIIGEDGVAKSYKIAKSSGLESFDRAALEVARLLEDKWIPARNACVPFESFILLPIAFKYVRSVSDSHN